MITRFSSRLQRLDRHFLHDRLAGALAYDRIAGFFSSSILEVAGEALEQVAGQVRMVCNSVVDPRDVQIAQRAAQAALRREWCASEPERLPDAARPRFARLHAFLASGKLKVRVLPDAHFGLIHGKAGVISAADGSRRAFLGSVNESKTAWRLSPYDRFIKGEHKAMTEDQVRGLVTFAEVGCTACHSGANFNGPALPMGTGFYQKFPTIPGSPYEAEYDLTADTGRFAATGSEADKHLWRVPTLRNIALTAPYFHNGAVPTLDEAVRVMAKTQLGRDLTDAQAADLVAFLGALTGAFPEIAMPRLPDTAGRTVIPSVSEPAQPSPQH
jgi:hypothetical protein